jgi:hypothetical protein
MQSNIRVLMYMIQKGWSSCDVCRCVLCRKVYNTLCVGVMYFLYLHLLEYGNLIIETCRRVQAYVWCLISLMHIWWYKLMIIMQKIRRYFVALACVFCLWNFYRRSSLYHNTRIVLYMFCSWGRNGHTSSLSTVSTVVQHMCVKPVIAVQEHLAYSATGTTRKPTELRYIFLALLYVQFSS